MLIRTRDRVNAYQRGYTLHGRKVIDSASHSLPDGLASAPPSLSGNERALSSRRVEQYGPYGFPDYVSGQYVTSPKMSPVGF